MNATCTCGVELVEGARFCHKCGRPVGGIDPIVEEPPPLPAAAAPPIAIAEPVPTAALVEFENRAAVRAGLMAVAIVALPVMFLGPVIGGSIMAVAPLIMGTLAVFLYTRRSGRQLSVIEGARQGWISGLFFFLIVLVITTLLFLLLSTNADMIPLIREQAKARGTLTPDMQQALEQMQHPGQLAGTILMGMLFTFVMFTSLSSLGGILGTRLFGSNGTRHTN